MERRARFDSSQNSFQYLFTLGIFIGIVLGLFATVLQINPLSRMMMKPPQSNEIEEGIKIQKALELVANFQLRPESNIPNALLKRAEEILAKLIALEVRVLCMVMTNSTRRQAAANAKRTWGRHCSKIIFMSDADDISLPSVSVGKEWHREGSWSKTISAFKHVWKNYKNDFDWVIKIDDSNFVFVEDLQEMLLPYTPDEPIFFGFRLNPLLPQGYMSENAGVVYSREIFMRLVTMAFDGKSEECPKWNDNVFPDDVKMGMCLASVKAEVGDSRDWEGRSRFFPLDVASHTFVEPAKYKWFWSYTFWPVFVGIEGCADKPVTFHYIKPATMYMIEYLAYYVRPFVVNSLEINTPAPTLFPPNTTTSESSSTSTTTTTSTTSKK